MTEDKKVLVSLNLSSAMWVQIKRIAKQEEIPASQLLRKWVNEGYKELKGAK